MLIISSDQKLWSRPCLMNFKIRPWYNYDVGLCCKKDLRLVGHSLIPAILDILKITCLIAIRNDIIVVLCDTVFSNMGLFDHKSGHKMSLVQYECTLSSTASILYSIPCLWTRPWTFDGRLNIRFILISYDNKN